MRILYLALSRPQTSGAWLRHRAADCVLSGVWL